MAGTGVGVGGTSMLRTRRRDVSIKPNRRLDRKSSRGMIYENEELRLRTININAEVEQGQNDIKKLRRENEQLRREIWSLRDEYDKLEELVKNQSSQGSSDEPEGAGEENQDDSCTEYSFDEDVVEEEEEDEDEDEEEEDEEEEEELPGDGKSREEHLENAENQKISSEKMSSSLHRLHVDFDDLSVVDEEEELKKDRDKKDSVISDDNNLHDQRTGTFRYFPSSYDLHPKYFTDCPFVFPNPNDPNYPKMLPVENSALLASPCSKTYNGPNLDTPAMGPVDPIFGHLSPSAQLSVSNYPLASPAMEIATTSGQIMPGTSGGSTYRDTSNPQPLNGFANARSLPQRRNMRFNQPVNFFNATTPLYEHPNTEVTPNSGDLVTQNGWDFSGPQTSQTRNQPKHFFAPLPSKLRTQRSVEDKVDTATSSSSDKTSSTVVSRGTLSRKGGVDVYVNGGFPVAHCPEEERHQQGGFVSSEDLVVDEVQKVDSSWQGSGNPLVKALSCQDLTTENQNLPFNDKLKLFNTTAKSDNTLDSISDSSRPFKSQLNVTLKLPKPRIPSSPDTPEIPKLPAINYRLFNNPFLQNFEQECAAANYVNFNVEAPLTRPLSIQVNENPYNNFTFSGPAVTSTTPLAPSGGQRSKIENDSRQLLLIAASQYRNLEEKARRPIGFEVTSFEGPSPQTLIQSSRMFPGVPRTMVMCEKVPAQTQTSIDGDRQENDERKGTSIKQQQTDPQTPSVSGSSPLTLRRKRTLRKERSGSIKDKRPLSPAAQRRKDRLRKQNSVTSSEAPESPIKTPVRSRKFSVSTGASLENQEKNESRSSSSGQDSPKKAEQRRRVSLYFNAKKRPSIVSTRMDNGYSLRGERDGQDATTTNSERERTNSVSSRETIAKGRKLSTGSAGKVPWCACWGNGCV